MCYIYREPYSEIISYTNEYEEIEKEQGIILNISANEEIAKQKCYDLMSENLQKYEAFIQSNAYKALEGTPVYDIISADINEAITILEGSLNNETYCYFQL